MDTLAGDEAQWWVVRNVEFARAVLPGVQLFADLLIEVAADDDSGHRCTQEEWNTVAAVLADRLIGHLTRLKDDGWSVDDEAPGDALLADVDQLRALLEDEPDERIISALATTFPGAVR